MRKEGRGLLVMKPTTPISALLIRYGCGFHYFSVLSMPRLGARRIKLGGTTTQTQKNQWPTRRRAMGTVGFIIFLGGAVLSTVAGIWLLVVAFRTSVWWGLGSFFIPFVVLIFTIAYWSEAKRPFLYGLGGSVIMFAGTLFMPGNSI